MGKRLFFQPERQGALLRDAVLFVLRAQNAVDRVGCAATGLVVVADLHFAEQADGEKIKTAKQQAESRHHQRAVCGHDRNVAQKFFYAQPQDDSTAAEDTQHAEAAEKVQRARQITQQEADGQQIEKHAEGTCDAVVRNAALAVHVADGNFADRRTVPRRQRRDEAVQLAVERDLLQNVAAISLECGTEIVDIDTGNFGHHPIGNAAGNAAHPEIVDAILAPSADDIVAGGDFFQEHRNVGGIVLQVAIHSDDVFPAGVVESGGESGGLAEVAAQFDDRDAAVNRRDLPQHGEGVIARSVVDQNDFEALPVRLHNRLQAVVEVGDVLLLVVQRDDNGVLGHDQLIINRNGSRQLPVVSGQLFPRYFGVVIGR